MCLFWRNAESWQNMSNREAIVDEIMAAVGKMSLSVKETFIEALLAKMSTQKVKEVYDEMVIINKAIAGETNA